MEERCFSSVDRRDFIPGGLWEFNRIRYFTPTIYTVETPAFHRQPRARRQSVHDRRWRSLRCHTLRILRTSPCPILLPGNGCRHSGVVRCSHKLGILHDSAHPQWILLFRRAGRRSHVDQRHVFSTRTCSQDKYMVQLHHHRALRWPACVCLHRQPDNMEVGLLAPDNAHCNLLGFYASSSWTRPSSTARQSEILFKVENLAFLRLLGIEQRRNNLIGNTFTKALKQPAVAITKPPVFLSSLYYMLVFAWIIGLNAAINVFIRQIYGFRYDQIGTVVITSLVNASCLPVSRLLRLRSSNRRPPRRSR